MWEGGGVEFRLEETLAARSNTSRRLLTLQYVSREKSFQHLSSAILRLIVKWSDGSSSVRREAMLHIFGQLRSHVDELWLQCQRHFAQTAS